MRAATAPSKRSLLIVLALALCGMEAHAPAQRPALLLSENSNAPVWRQRPLAGPAASAAEPDVAVSGQRWAAVWSSGPADNNRIWISEQGLSPQILDGTPGGDNREPSIRFAPGAAQPSVAWVHRSGLREVVFLGTPNERGSWDATAISGTEQARIESPTLGFLDARSPYLAWLEADGTTSEVMVAWHFAGQWQTRRLSETGSYAMAPQALDQPAPRVWWYAIEGAATRLLAADVAKWGVSQPRNNVELSSVNRFAIAFEDPTSELPGLAWVDSSDGLDGVVVRDGATGRETRLAAAEPAAQIDEASVGAGAIAGWIETSRSRRTIRIAAPGQRVVAFPAHRSASGLRVAHDSGLGIAVWVNQPAQGGDGSVLVAVSSPSPRARLESAPSP